MSISKMLKNYKKRDYWIRTTETFSIKICHWSYTYEWREPRHKWNVYAYIYKEHPHYKNFDKTTSFLQQAACIMPFHWGCTYLKYHLDDDNNILCVQVGSDYAHLGDDRFEKIDNPEYAREVFEDAEELYNWLKSYEDNNENS